MPRRESAFRESAIERTTATCDESDSEHAGWEHAEHTGWEHAGWEHAELLLPSSLDVYSESHTWRLPHQERAGNQSVGGQSISCEGGQSVSCVGGQSVTCQSVACQSVTCSVIEIDGSFSWRLSLKRAREMGGLIGALRRALRQSEPTAPGHPKLSAAETRPGGGVTPGGGVPLGGGVPPRGGGAGGNPPGGVPLGRVTNDQAAGGAEPSAPLPTPPLPPLPTPLDPRHRHAATRLSVDDLSAGGPFVALLSPDARAAPYEMAHSAGRAAAESGEREKSRVS